MSLGIKTSKAGGDIAVVRVSGNMTFDETTALTALIQVLLDQGEKKLILDLSGIDEIDSLGGMALIRCFFAARESEANLCVADASSSVAKLFKSCRADTLIKFLPTVAAACEHVAVTPKAKAHTA